MKKTLILKLELTESKGAFHYIITNNNLKDKSKNTYSECIYDIEEGDKNKMIYNGLRRLKIINNLMMKTLGEIFRIN